MDPFTTSLITGATQLFAPKPKAPQAPGSDVTLDPTVEEDERNIAAQQEQKRKRAGRIARVFGGQNGVLIPQTSVGRTRLFGQ